VKIAIIAALDKDRAIGKDGKLPWHIPDDLKHFKSVTSGHAVLMGRKTFASLGRPLPNRRNVVVTSHLIAGVESYASVPDALAALKGEEVVFVIGGASLYSQLLERADFLYLTLVDGTYAADTFFPPYEHLIDTVFAPILCEAHEGFSFLTYRRISR